MISRPESKFNIVVFPQPEGPTIAVKVLGENFPEHGFRIFFFPSIVFNPPFSLGTYTYTSAITYIFEKIY